MGNVGYYLGQIGGDLRLCAQDNLLDQTVGLGSEVRRLVPH